MKDEKLGMNNQTPNKSILPISKGNYKKTECPSRKLNIEYYNQFCKIYSLNCQLANQALFSFHYR